jgi:hypothetical protein
MRSFFWPSVLLAVVAWFAEVSKCVHATPPTDWVAECRAFGFDPDQLACQTCDILPTQFIAKCQICCQSWLDTKRITKPYAAAILVDRGTGGDVATFLKDDWDDILKTKGNYRLLRLSATKEQSQYTLFMLRPSQLLFFDDASVVSNRKLTSDLPSLVKLAADSYYLDGMKREDIKDMLLTLLP